jgi:hypothetical protein
MNAAREITADDVRAAMEKLDRGEPPPRLKRYDQFEIEHDGKRYSARAVMRLAATQVSGASAKIPQDDNKLVGFLRGLGFGVVPTTAEVRDKDPWDAFIGWARKFHEHARFDEIERKYKLEMAKSLTQVRSAMEAGDVTWTKLLTDLLYPPHGGPAEGQTERIGHPA